MEDMSIEALLCDCLHVIELLKVRHVILIGHSLGGAVMTRVASAPSSEKVVLGLIVIDAIEEVANASIGKIDFVLASRPKRFATLEEAAAKARGPVSKLSLRDQLREQGDGTWTWKADLEAMRSSWPCWFAGQDERFLKVGCPKLLITSDVELSKPLLVGQMQGRFQLFRVRNSSHMLHEECPEQISEALLSFIKRTSSMLPPSPIGNKL